MVMDLNELLIRAKRVYEYGLRWVLDILITARSNNIIIIVFILKEWGLD